MLTFNGNLEQIAMISFGNKIVLEMQNICWKKLSSVIQTSYM